MTCTLSSVSVFLCHTCTYNVHYSTDLEVNCIKIPFNTHVHICIHVYFVGPRVYLCVNYCSDIERREDERSQQRSLQERVRQLEEANRQHGEEKATAVDRLSRERGELRHVQCTCSYQTLFQCLCTLV